MLLNFSLNFSFVFAVCCCLSLCRGQFPPQCANEECLLSKTCCPVNSRTGLVCGGQGLGVCHETNDDEMTLRCNDCESYPAYGLDERWFWPSVFFTSWCECEWPFHGTSCDQCEWGYYGDDCQEKKTLLRKNANNNIDVLERTLLYLTWLKGNISDRYVVASCTLDTMIIDGEIDRLCYSDVSFYDYLVWIHWYGSTSYSSSILVDFLHASSGFPTWHRKFSLILERSIQRLIGDDDYALPYYDWIGEPSCTLCTDGLLGKSGSDGFIGNSSFFRDWVSICEGYYYLEDGVLCDVDKDLGMGVYRITPGDLELPTKEDLRWTLTWPDFDTYPYSGASVYSFRNALSGKLTPSTGEQSDDFEMHILGHTYFGGTMVNLASAANDPLFQVFHPMVDYILESWIDRWWANMSDTYPKTRAAASNNRYDFMFGFFPPETHDRYFRPSVDLGYTYEPTD